MQEAFRWTASHAGPELTPSHRSRETATPSSGETRLGLRRGAGHETCCGVFLGGAKTVVLFGSAFLAIWFLALAFFHASGTGFNLMLLVPIASFLARSLQEARHRS